jgi:multiple antibiotic resistance protein
MNAELRQIVEGALLVIGALIPIVNPFGGAPVFLAMTAGCSADLRRSLATRVAVNAFILLFGSVFVGTYVLDFFGLSVPIVQVAGGLIVCALGWDLLRQDSVAPNPMALGGPAEIATRAFYPLTLPLTVGPGTISVAITLGANHSQHGVRSLLVNGAALLIGVTLVAATILVCYRYADRMLHRLGATGTSVLVRLSAFILLCIGVQIFWNGASALVDTLPAFHGR